LDRLLERCSGGTLSPEAYVTELRNSLRTTHKAVADAVASETEALRDSRRKQAASSGTVKVGDHVFLRRPPAPFGEGAATSSVSARLRPKADPRLYAVQKLLGPQTVVLADPDTGSTDIGLTQPVHVSRLIPYNLCDLEASIESDRRPRLELLGPNGEVTKMILLAQSATGAVRAYRESDGQEELLDLSCLEYRWVS
jgi:hypothetical protein